MRKIEIDKKELYQYYIVGNHSQEEAAKYFNCSVGTIERRVKEYGFKKTKEIDKEELYQYYIIENHSQEETAKYFGVCRDVIKKRVKKYGFKKTKEQIQTKIRAAWAENWEYEHPMQNPDVQAKARATWLRNWGYENPMQNPDVQAKARATWLRNLGYENPMQSPEVQAKARATRMEKGCNLNNKDLNLDKIIEWLENRGPNGTTLDKLAEFMRNHPTAAGTFVRRHGLKKWINYGSSVSKQEKEIRSFIKENYDGEVIYNDRKVLDRKEIDILLPNLKLGIEFNGLYRHRTMQKPDKTTPKDKYYHHNKAVTALEKGYHLYFITDDEWRDNQEEVKTRILDMLTDKQDVSNILGYTEPNYYYTNGRKKYRRSDNNLPKPLVKAFSLGDDEEWEYAESKGYYRYYDCGEPIFKIAENNS